MVARLIVGGALWLGVMVLFGAGLHSPVPARQAPEPWSITQMRTAHHAMIVDVVAQHVDKATSIAEEIVESVRGRGYGEVLVYVRGPGERGEPAERRVQWTPGGGFSVLVIRE